jgi:hypothetical protein
MPLAGSVNRTVPLVPVVLIWVTVRVSPSKSQSLAIRSTPVAETRVFPSHHEATVRQRRDARIELIAVGLGVDLELAARCNHAIYLDPCNRQQRRVSHRLDVDDLIGLGHELIESDRVSRNRADGERNVARLVSIVLRQGQLKARKLVRRQCPRAAGKSARRERRVGRHAVYFYAERLRAISDGKLGGDVEQDGVVLADDRVRAAEALAEHAVLGPVLILRHPCHHKAAVGQPRHARLTLAGRLVRVDLELATDGSRDRIGLSTRPALLAKRGGRCRSRLVLRRLATVNAANLAIHFINPSSRAA